MNIRLINWLLLTGASLVGPANLAGLATQGRFTTEVSPAALAGALLYVGWVSYSAYIGAKEE